ncbi:MAG: thiosulfate oxidation carrier protein SoxY [Betaproteobacteria bacterium RIFCSPLOWO2_02_FULL_67_26]|nr:MAG: thiosulfate oxidation carrier protein SoxY [Betaproteobacteria bacterium RIFCSPLOWO2_02_FULL_67_26]
MNPYRRSLLAFAGGAGTLVIAAAAGLLRTGQAWAATWNKAGFESKAMADVMKSLGATGAAESKDIVITAPDIAENGAVVPIAVTSRIPGTQQISIVAEKNPFPLAATFDVAGGGEGYVSTRIKMGQTSDVWAIVKAGGKVFTARKEVKITVGGCG